LDFFNCDKITNPLKFLGISRERDSSGTTEPPKAAKVMERIARREARQRRGEAARPKKNIFLVKINFSFRIFCLILPNFVGASPPSRQYNHYRTFVNHINIMDLIRYVSEQTTRDLSKFDYFKAGDNVAVVYEIVEGDKKREQTFRGDIIQLRGQGATKTFTIRKISSDIGVERIFPFNCPSLISITNLKKGKVRRARLFYLREQKGKSARIRDKRFGKPQEAEYKGKKRKMTWYWEDAVKYV
jgi:large subunit ribosomal protein L19